MLRWILVAVVILGVASQCWGPPKLKLWGRGVGCGGQVIEIEGRLVDDTNGAPLPGVGVAAFQYEHEVREPKAAAVLLQLSRSARAGSEMDRSEQESLIDSMYLHDDAFALTDDTGRFRLKLWRWHCREFAGDEPLGPAEPPERTGLHALMVEPRAGATPILITLLPRGSWTRRPQASGSDASFGEASATWDLGDVRVPPAPPR